MLFFTCFILGIYLYGQNRRNQGYPTVLFVL